MIAQLWMLIQIAFRNLRASPINLLIGLLIFGGTLLFVVFGSLLDSLNVAMSKSIIGSIAGHVQLYSSKSKDELSLYGSMGGDPDLSAVTDFPKIKEALETLPNVKVVVPMGSSGALITAGNAVDIALDTLRNLYKAKEGKDVAPKFSKLTPAEIDSQIVSEKSHIRQIIKVLQADAQKALEILDKNAIDKEAQANLAKVSQDDFWNHFDDDTNATLDFLDTKIAPQVTDGQLLFLRYLGTDLDKFQTSFDRMEIVDGQPVPKGQRGFLIAKFFYEENMKLKSARRLDRIKEAMVAGRTIEKDEELQRFVRENRTQTRDIVLQLDAIRTAKMTEGLKKMLSAEDTDVSALLTKFFDTTDANFNDRYAYFYSDIAPLIELYRVRIGDTLTIKAFSRGGSIQAVNMKVYGTFGFKGLEKSPLAGSTSLMDLMSFRDLYGYLTADKLEELKEIKEDTGAKEITRENAEADLFGGESNNVVAEATAGVIDADKALSGMARKLRTEDLVKRVYTQSEIDTGVVLNAAVMLKDDTKIEQAIADINALSEAKGLGIKAVSWQKASGILGQIVNVFRAILIAVTGLIFMVAIFIMLNAFILATLSRTQMIGTMRAIGAQVRLILAMVFTESLVLGILFGSAGILSGSLLIGLAHNIGIPAPNDIAYFFFSGPRLRPDVSVMNMVVAISIVMVVSIISTLIPAVMATRVSPLTAMQADE